MNMLFVYPIKLSLLLILYIFIGNYFDYLIETSIKSILIILIFIWIYEYLQIIVSSYKTKKINSITINFIFTITILLFLFTILETAFLFIPRSHTVGHTKAARMWNSYFVRLNSLGFRDPEPVQSDSSILFVGDSFTFGAGIINQENRYSNIVDKRLSNYKSINIGMGGGDTEAEYKTMLEFYNKTNIRPKIIVLQYYGNDIEREPLKSGIPFKRIIPYLNLNYFTLRIVKGSHFFNFMYWLYPQTETNSYIEYLTQAYTNENIFGKHKEHLNDFVEYAHKENIKLIVVVFPFLTNLPLGEKIYVNRIIDFFENKGVETINVSDLVKNYDSDDLVINNNDNHPSIFVNKIVAEELMRIVNRKFVSSSN